ncbi:MAG TPA: thioredoxin domain-containing protein [Kofleriaceae bacterium]
MKQLSAVMFVAAAVMAGCQPKAAQSGATTPAPPALPVSAAPTPAPVPTASGDHTGTVEQRLARIEDQLAQSAEALVFLRKVYEAQKAQQQAADRDESAEDAMYAVNVADAVKAGQVDGPATAAVTIVKAFDFACPYCQSTVEPMRELVAENKGKVRVVYMNLVVHAPARPAHLASCAAARQGKYKEFKDAFWTKGFEPYAQRHDPSLLGEDNIAAIAKGVGLDVGKLKADMKSPACEARITADMAELQKFHVDATPTFFINGHLVAGARPKEDFQHEVDDALKQVTASGVPAAQYYDKVVLAKGEKAFRSKMDPKPGS